MAQVPQKPPFPDGYWIFTKDFDREVSAKDLRAELENATPGLAARLVDTRVKLDDPLLKPTQVAERAAIFRERWRAGHSLGRRPLVTILADHSGSLRERPSQVVASVLIAISEALEIEGIDFEVLGFTTSSWQGGNSRRRWVGEDRPLYPGRLCDVLHIVYRDAVLPHPDWAGDLVLITANELLKENVDGEAILWAAMRAERFAPSTWICLCVTDGAPVDDSTIEANGAWFLPGHLDQVVKRFEAEEATRLGCLSLAPVESSEFNQPYRIVVETGLQPYQASIRVFDVLEALIWPGPLPAEQLKADLSSDDTKEPE